ncbi:DNA (cytosine-5-)-methyltransferase [Alkalicoccus daliensis]|uniref:Cytosine-specific methyltransferase n=1 Tax=Alkalicoccus daliensis TaxID=745820 RepID=A0A1H0E9L0_9BACI|nr:DNA (cytosine-5-)-methyltransferase [Alkalicoccus daliensis]SDN78976.1 DNA (cytosine-5)-methyltransferase 1 [Alkalicoccus daliensis]
MKKLTVGSLFAGVGGIDLGFEKAGAEIVWANEIDKNAAVTYRLNFSNELIEEDIRNIDEYNLPDIDILTAGWPCVAFSVAGRRHGMSYLCSECNHQHMVTFEEYLSTPQCPQCKGSTEPIDPRGTLFYDVLRFIRAKKPRAFLLENVKNLRGHDGGKTFEVIQEMLKSEGYHFESRVMNTMEYADVPQNRERIFIVGFRDEKILSEFKFPDKKELNNTIDNILERKAKQEDKFYYKKESPYYKMLSESIKRQDTVYQLRRVYVRENQSNVCPTLTANMGTGGHNVPLVLDNWGIRKLTPREAFGFQGFPKEFMLPENMANSHLYKQAGNSVTVPIVQQVAANMLQAINKVDKNQKDRVEQIKLFA